jgi:hypothetical protein
MDEHRVAGASGVFTSTLVTWTGSSAAEASFSPAAAARPAASDRADEVAARKIVLLICHHVFLLLSF